MQIFKTMAIFIVTKHFSSVSYRNSEDTVTLVLTELKILFFYGHFILIKELDVINGCRQQTRKLQSWGIFFNNQFSIRM